MLNFKYNIIQIVPICEKKNITFVHHMHNMYINLYNFLLSILFKSKIGMYLREHEYKFSRLCLLYRLL